MTAAVVDPSVLVSAFIGNPDAAPGLVGAWREDRFVMVVSLLLLNELTTVLARPKFARWAADDRASAYIAGFALHSRHHADAADPPAAVRDPYDDYIVALARTAAVDAVVSLDRDLLEAPVDDLTIGTPAAFLDRL